MSKIFDLPSDWFEQFKDESPEMQSLAKKYPPNVLYEYKGAFKGIIVSMKNDCKFLMRVDEELNPSISRSFYIEIKDFNGLKECEIPDGTTVEAVLITVKGKKLISHDINNKPKEEVH